MNEPVDPLSHAAAIVHSLKRAETEELVADAERSDDRTLRSLAWAYRLTQRNPM